MLFEQIIETYLQQIIVARRSVDTHNIQPHVHHTE